MTIFGILPYSFIVLETGNGDKGFTVQNIFQRFTDKVSALIPTNTRTNKLKKFLQFPFLLRCDYEQI